MKAKLFAALAGLLLTGAAADAQWGWGNYGGYYNPYTGGVVQSGYTFNPYTGGAAQATSYYNPYTFGTAYGQTVYNPFTGLRYDAVQSYSPFTGYQTFGTVTPAWRYRGLRGFWR